MKKDYKSISTLKELYEVRENLLQRIYVADAQTTESWAALGSSLMPLRAVGKLVKEIVKAASEAALAQQICKIITSLFNETFSDNER